MREKPDVKSTEHPIADRPCRHPQGASTDASDGSDEQAIKEVQHDGNDLEAIDGASRLARRFADGPSLNPGTDTPLVMGPFTNRIPLPHMVRRSGPKK